MGEFSACFGAFLVLTRVFRLLTRGGGKRDDEDNTTGSACGSGPGGLGVRIPRICHGIQCSGSWPPSLMAPDARVRGSSQRLVAAISDAAAGSQTFRNLVDQIGRTDGIVYVMEGQCQRGVRACLLLSMTVMGANRVLWIRIDPRKVDRDLMGSIGHELQHALEVLSHSSIRSGSAMTLLYKKEGSKEGGHFETDAAIKAGNAVRAELRESAAVGSER